MAILLGSGDNSPFHRKRWNVLTQELVRDVTSGVFSAILEYFCMEVNSQLAAISKHHNIV